MRHIALTSCLALQAGLAAADAPKVVTDILPVQGLVAAVMEGVGSPDVLIQPGASPHSYALKPSQSRALDQAELVFWIGAGLTPWMLDPLDTLAGDAHVISLLEAAGTRVLPTREEPIFEASALLGDAHDHDDHGDNEDHSDAHDHGHDEDHGDEKAHDHDEHGHDADHGDEDAHDHDEHGHDADHGDEDAHGHDDHGHDEDHGDEKAHDHDEHGHDEGHGDEDAHDHDDHGHDEDHGDEKAHDHDEHGHDEDHDDHGHDDHAHDHGPNDPHAWLDPANAQTWLALIAEELSEIDPENAETYAANAAAAIAEIQAVSDEIAPGLENLSGFVVYHDAYQYFETRFNLSPVGALSVSDAVPPGPARLAALRDAMVAQGATCIFTEPQYSARLVTAVSDNLELRVADLDPLGTDIAMGSGFYPALLQNLSDTIKGCAGDAE